MRCAIGGQPRQPTRKHTAYDRLELNRRKTPLWGLDRGGFLREHVNRAKIVEAGVDFA